MLLRMRVTDEQKFLAELGKRIAQIRRSKDVTQERLAELTGLDRVAIAYIETGKRRPNIATVYRLARGLDIRLVELFKGY